MNCAIVNHIEALNELFNLNMDLKEASKLCRLEKKAYKLTYDFCENLIGV